MASDAWHSGPLWLRPETRELGVQCLKALRPGGQNNTMVKHTNSSQNSETAVLAPAFMSLTCGWVTWYLYV